MNTRDLSFNAPDEGSAPQTPAVPKEAMAGAGFDPSASAGVFIGVRHFTKTKELKEVPYAVDDAVDMAYRFSVELGLVEAAGVSLCLSGDPQKPESRRRLAELQNKGARVGDADIWRVCEEIKGAAKRAKPEGALFCSVATHGFQDPQTGISYIVMADTYLDKISKSALTVTELEQDLGTTKCRRRFLLMDACREFLLTGGPSKRNVGNQASDGIANALAKFEGAVVFSATGAGGLAYDDEEAKNGVFTRGILEGLNGAATPDAEGIIRAGQLADYANAFITKWIEREEKKRNMTLKFSGIQTSFEGEGSRPPLAIRPEAYAAAQRSATVQTFEGQRQMALSLMEEAVNWPGFSEELVADVTAVINSGSRDEQTAVLKRIERLYVEGEDYAEDFVGWWQRRHGDAPGSSPSHSGVRQALPPFEAEVEVDLDTIIAGGFASVALEMPKVGIRRMEVRIPRWTAEGEIVRIPREGPGGADIHLSVRHVVGHRFRMENGELTTDLTISVVDAFKGATKPLLLPDGDVGVTIPPGSKDGSLVIVPGKGMRTPGQPTGDLCVRLRVEASQADDRESDSSSMNLTLEQLIQWRPVEGSPMPGRKNWRVVRKLGEGGFGEAWLIEQPKSMQQRVLKFCFDLNHLAALRREVTLLRTLYQNPLSEGRVARVLDWNLDSPPHYLEFAYYPAGSLDDYAKRVGGMEKISFAQRLRFMAQVAGALSFAHSQRVLHRDLKPSNIFIEETPTEGQRALLADFGIGTIEGGVSEAIPGVTMGTMTKTGSGQIGLGTRLYLAPELLEGKPPSAASDIYAFGVTFFQVMSGDTTRAFGHGWEKYLKIKELQQIVALCVNVNPDDRIRDVETIHKRLQFLVSERGLEHRKTPSVPQAPEPEKLPLRERLKFWKKRDGPVWESSRVKPKGNFITRPLAALGRLVKWVLAPISGLGWLLPVIGVMLVIFLFTRAGDFLFKKLLLGEISRTAKNDGDVGQGLGDFARVYGTPGAAVGSGGGGETANGSPAQPMTDPAETFFRNHAPGYFQNMTREVYTDLGRLYETAGNVPNPQVQIESASTAEDGTRKAIVIVDIPAWITDQRAMPMVCVLHRGKRFDDTKYMIALSGPKAAQFVFSGEQKPAAPGTVELPPVYTLVTMRPDTEWAAAQKMVADLGSFPDRYFQKGLSLKVLLANPDLIPDAAMATYLRAAVAADGRSEGTLNALNGAKDGLANEKSNIKSYRSTISSLQRQRAEAEKRKRDNNNNNNRSNNQDNSPPPEFYDGQIRQYQNMIEAAEKRIPILTRNVTINSRRVEQDQMERDLQFLNLANYLTTRFPYQSNEAARRVLANKEADLSIRHEANQVLNYSRFLIGKE
ncbi:protein kinase [bacterium]|nr:protein kinase [bacterium]